MRPRSDDKGRSNVDCGRYAGVMLALCDFRSLGDIAIGDDVGNLSSSEPAAHGELVLVHYFFFCFLGGVTGRPEPMPP